MCTSRNETDSSWIRVPPSVNSYFNIRMNFYLIVSSVPSPLITLNIFSPRSAFSSVCRANFNLQTSTPCTLLNFGFWLPRSYVRCDAIINDMLRHGIHFLSASSPSWFGNSFIPTPFRPRKCFACIHLNKWRYLVLFAKGEKSEGAKG